MSPFSEIAIPFCQGCLCLIQTFSRLVIHRLTSHFDPHRIARDCLPRWQPEFDEELRQKGWMD